MSSVPSTISSKSNSFICFVGIVPPLGIVISLASALATENTSPVSSFKVAMLRAISLSSVNNSLFSVANRTLRVPLLPYKYFYEFQT